jgi:hypothetical protein
MPGKSQHKASRHKGTTHGTQSDAKPQNYIEIYINESGIITFMPLTNGTCGFVKAVSTKYSTGQNYYCG